jgi:hypothetical protein
MYFFTFYYLSLKTYLKIKGKAPKYQFVKFVHLTEGYKGANLLFYFKTLNFLNLFL